MASLNRYGFAVLCISLLVVPSHGGFIGTMLDRATPFLSTADAGSDAYVCYHFWETAKAAHIRPVFFSCSLALIILSSSCGVFMFLLQNWGKSDDKEDDEAVDQSIAFRLLGLEDDDEGEEIEGGEGTGCWPRLRIRARLDRLTSCVPECLKTPLQCFMVVFLIILLLPVGQLLPIILWFQAQQETGKGPKLPVRPEKPLMPNCPQDFAALNNGNEPIDIADFIRIWKTGTLRQRVSEEWQSYRIKYAKEYNRYDRAYTGYLYLKDRYFSWETSTKIKTSLPFIIETLQEAVPQSLLQTTAIVIDSQRDPEAISWVQFFSIATSMLSIASKAYILCTSLLQSIYNFKMLCVAHDVAALFYTVAALWSARRGDDDAVNVFFLTRPVDFSAACYLYIWFTVGCLFCMWCLLRSIAVIFEWHIVDALLVDDSWDGEDSDSVGRLGKPLLAVATFASKWPVSISLFDKEKETPAEDVFVASRAPTLNRAFFTLASVLLVVAATSIGLVFVIVPLGTLLLMPRMYWICLWLKHLETQMTEPLSTAPRLARVDEIASLVSENRDISDLHGGNMFSFEGVLSPDEQSGYLHLADDVDTVFAARSRVTGELSEFIQRTHPSNEWLWVAIEHVACSRDFRIATALEEYNERCNTISGLYVQAFTWASEEADLGKFGNRLEAVKNGIISWVEKSAGQITSSQQTLIDENARVKVPRFLLPRILYLVVANVGDSLSLLKAPSGWYNIFAGSRLDGTFGNWSGNGLLRAARVLQSVGGGDERQTIVFNAQLTSWRGLRPYFLIYAYVILPCGWLVQKLLIGACCVFAVFSTLFPLVSFSLVVSKAVRDNQCADMKVLRGDAKITQSSILSAMRALFDDECYNHSGTPLNAFRASLFLLEAILFIVAASYGGIAASQFIKFSLVIPKCWIDDDDFSSDERGLMKHIIAIHERLHMAIEEDAIGDGARTGSVASRRDSRTLALEDDAIGDGPRIGSMAIQQDATSDDSHGLE